MWPFKRKPESSQEIAAEKRLDEATRGVAWDEFDKEERRETLGGAVGPLSGELFPEERAGDADKDLGDERPLRDVMRDADEKS